MESARPGSCPPRRVAIAAAAALAVMASASAARAQEAEEDEATLVPLLENCTTECHQDLTAFKFRHGPASQQCRACHVQVGDEGHDFTLILPTNELCRKCHAAAAGRSTHAPVSEGQCLECHDPHGSDHRRLLVANPAKELCLRCHAESFSAHEYVHGPVATGACVVCHEAHASAQPHLLVADSTALCLTCHGEIQTEPDAHRTVHAALQEGCTGCHDPHASDHRFQLHAQAPDLCLGCHQDKMDELTAGATAVHAALGQAGGCTTCHEPHSSALPRLQRAGQPEVCLACHNERLGDGSGKGLTDMAALLADNPNHHGPIREGACTACHDPHAGEHFRLLVEDYPAAFYAPFKPETFALCFRCHIPDLVLQESAHGLTNFRDGDRNLHWLHVNQAKGRTCRACHEVHASKRPFHIRESVPFGTTGWMLEINFEPGEEGGSCAPACHKPRTYTRGVDPPAAPAPARPVPQFRQSGGIR